MKRINGKLFPAIFLIVFAVVAGIGTKTVSAADAVPEENGAPADSCNPDSPLAIITESLPAGSVDVAYSQKIQASGGIAPYLWNVSIGYLPAGLSLGEKTGEVTGAPKAVGTSSFTVRVTDSQKPAASVTKTLSFIITPPVLNITTENLPDGTVRFAYNRSLQATGGFFPYKWTISAGTLPAGLSLNAENGVISGTLKTAGTSKFTVQVTDSQKPAKSVTRDFSIKIEPSVLPNMWFSPK